MSTRFRFPSAGTADVSPAFQSYTHAASTSRFSLELTDSSALSTVAQTPDAADDLTTGDTFHAQFVSDPMDAGKKFTNGDTIKLAIQCLEANAANNLFVQLFVSIVDRYGTTVRATIRTKVQDNTELATSLTNRIFSTTQDGATYVTQSGDRLVVELSVQGLPTASGGVQGHNASLRFGSNGSSGDLPEDDTTTATTNNPWIEFVPNLTFGQDALRGISRNPTVPWFTPRRLFYQPTPFGDRNANLTGVQGEGQQGGVSPSPEVERPRVVTGPWPFPKEKPAFLPSITSPDVTVGLSGVAASAAIGLLTATLTLGLLGISATVSAGQISASPEVERPRVVRSPWLFPQQLRTTVIPIQDRAAALTGVQATGATGTLGSALDVGETGVQATGTVGSMSASPEVERPRIIRSPWLFPNQFRTTRVATPPPSPDVTVGLTGVQGTGAPGSLGVALDVGETGVQGAGSAGSLSASPEVERPRIIQSPWLFPNQFRTTRWTTTDVSVNLSGVQATGALGTLTPSGSVYFDRPRVVIGPFPFPKEAPAFPISSPDRTVFLTGVQGVGQIGNLAVLGPVVDRPYSLWGPAGFLPGGNFKFIQPQPFVPSIPQTNVAITGVQATGAVGSVSPSPEVERPRTVRSPWLFPQQFSTKVIKFSDVSVTLTGVQTNGNIGSISPSPEVERPRTIRSPWNQFRVRYIRVADVVVSSDVTIALTGVSATGAVGTLSPSDTVSESGVQGSGNVGIVVPGDAPALVGQSATGAVGTESPSTTIGCSGVQGSGSCGTEGNSHSHPLTGVQATGGVGTLLPLGGNDRIAALVGVQATATVGSLALGAGTIDVVGIYDTTIDVAGIYDTIIDVTGHYQTTIDVVGEQD